MFHVDWPRRLAFASAVSIAVGAALPAAVALASRAPRPGERKAIIYALTHAGGRLALPTGTTVGSIRISTLDADYASATLINSRVGDANALLEKEGRAPSAWAVIDIGSDMVGCGFVNDVLRYDLREVLDAQAGLRTRVADDIEGCLLSVFQPLTEKVVPNCRRLRRHPLPDASTPSRRPRSAAETVR